MVPLFSMHAVIAAARNGILGGAAILTIIACSSSRTGSTETDAGYDAADAADAADARASLPYPLDQVCAPATDPSLDACARCARESCCDTRARLLTDAGNALIDCLQVPSCGSDCQAACFDQAPGETRPFLEHFSCLSHRCETCGATRDACATCMEARCLRETIACDLSRDCFVVAACVAACKGADACVAACNKRYPAAGPLNGALLVCASNLCARECQ